MKENNFGNRDQSKKILEQSSFLNHKTSCFKYFSDLAKHFISVFLIIILGLLYLRYTSQTESLFNKARGREEKARLEGF